MPTRDRSAAAVARESEDEQTARLLLATLSFLTVQGAKPEKLRQRIVQALDHARRAERARVRRIVRRELATWEREGDPPVYAFTRVEAVARALNTILAALREGKGTR